MQSKLTRRAVLAGAPAVAAVAAVAASAVIGHADAASDSVLSLYKQWCDGRAEAADISARARAAEKTIPAEVCAALDAYPYRAAAPQALRDTYQRLTSRRVALKPWTRPARSFTDT